MVTWPFSVWRLLTEASTSSTDVVVRRGCCNSSDPQKPDTPVQHCPGYWSRITVLTGTSAGTLYALGGVFLVILQPKISAGEPYAVATSMHSLLPFLQSIMPSKGAVEAGDLWDLKCLQLSSPEGEDQRHNSYIIVKEKNERPFGTRWSKKSSPSFPTERAGNAGEHLWGLSFTRGRERDAAPSVSWMQVQKLSSTATASAVMCSG